MISKLTNDKNKIEIAKINRSEKRNNILSRSQNFIKKLRNYNINYNLINKNNLKQNQNNTNYEIDSYKNLNKKENNNDTFYLNNSKNKKHYKYNTTQIKKSFFNKNNRTQDFFSNNLNDNAKKTKDEKEDSKERRKRNIFNNKSSLNFQLVSGVSKERLLKLSRNLSKNIIKSYM